jgi:hypothetical protein
MRWANTEWFTAHPQNFAFSRQCTAQHSPPNKEMSMLIFVEP